jgi:hypothetical protein
MTKICNSIIINNMLPLQGAAADMLSLSKALPWAMIYQAFSLKIPCRPERAVYLSPMATPWVKEDDHQPASCKDSITFFVMYSAKNIITGLEKDFLAIILCSFQRILSFLHLV